MTPFDRQVRAQIFELLIGGATHVDSRVIAGSKGWSGDEVVAAISRLVDEHRIAVVPGTDRIAMAHPFSGVETSYKATIGDRSWFANCAWDGLAILALMGDGEVHADAPEGRLVWRVHEGTVSPNGIVHLLVPARSFWEDVAFT